MIRLHDVLAGSGGNVEGDISEQFLFRRVIHDSRYVQPGDLFIALPGEFTDGHLYIADARERGAAAVMVARGRIDDALKPDAPAIVVDDTLVALHRLATYWRGLFDLQVIGITGSIGKSSTKEVVGSILGARFNVAKSVRSYNEVGLPISVLEITPDTDVCVLEMGGAYAFGEIRQLCDIARPTVGIVTVVSHSHLARMGSLEAIAETKTEFIEALPLDGLAVLNHDDARVLAMAERAECRVVTYGIDHGATYRAVDLESHGLGGISFTLVRAGRRDHVQAPLMGRHSVHTALVGFAVGFELGMTLDEILRGLAEPNIQLRLILTPGIAGATLLDDTYNANPTSSFAALALLQELDAKRKVAVFGDMLELGDFELEGHRMVGARIATTADAFYAVGPLARIMADEARTVNPALPIWDFETKDQLVAALKQTLLAGDLVLIKGSRGVRMETVVAELRAREGRDGRGLTILVPLLATGVVRLAGHAVRSDALLPSDPNDNLAISLGLSGLAFIVTVLAGGPFIRFLRAHKVGKQIRIDGPEGHMIRRNADDGRYPVRTARLSCSRVMFNLYGRLSMFLPLGVLIGCSILGGIDDRLNLVGGQSAGLTARFKFVWLFLFAGVTALVLYYPLGLSRVYVPFLGQYDIGPIYMPIAVFAIVGTANAVNLTDGLDTLAGGTASVAFVAYGIIAYLQGQIQVVTFCFMMVGAVLGFLWFNAHPAQLFMGDTGSLGLGASLATAAFMTGQWLLLPLVGAVFFAETISVMLQVAYFKWTKGKRIFRMTPLHHHFELVGWSETQITMRFWLIGMMAGLLGVALALQ